MPQRQMPNSLSHMQHQPQAYRLYSIGVWSLTLAQPRLHLPVRLPFAVPCMQRAFCQPSLSAGASFHQVRRDDKTGTPNHYHIPWYARKRKVCIGQWHAQQNPCWEVHPIPERVATVGKAAADAMGANARFRRSPELQAHSCTVKTCCIRFGFHRRLMHPLSRCVGRQEEDLARKKESHPWPALMARLGT